MIDLADIDNGDLYADIVNAAEAFRREHHFENGGAFVIIRPISFDKMKFCKENEFNFIPCGVGESICTAIKDAELNKCDPQVFINVQVVRVADYQIKEYFEENDIKPQERRK